MCTFSEVLTPCTTNSYPSNYITRSKCIRDGNDMTTPSCMVYTVRAKQIIHLRIGTLRRNYTGTTGWAISIELVSFMMDAGAFCPGRQIEGTDSNCRRIAVNIRFHVGVPAGNDATQRHQKMGIAMDIHAAPEANSAARSRVMKHSYENAATKVTIL